MRTKWWHVFCMLHDMPLYARSVYFQLWKRFGGHGSPWTLPVVNVSFSHLLPLCENTTNSNLILIQVGLAFLLINQTFYLMGRTCKQSWSFNSKFLVKCFYFLHRKVMYISLKSKNSIIVILNITMLSYFLTTHTVMCIPLLLNLICSY